jgi:hypothetical protein
MFGSPIRFRPARQEQIFNVLYSKQGEYTHFPRVSHRICAAAQECTTVSGMGRGALSLAVRCPQSHCKIVRLGIASKPG